MDSYRFDKCCVFVVYTLNVNWKSRELTSFSWGVCDQNGKRYILSSTYLLSTLAVSVTALVWVPGFSLHFLFRASSYLRFSWPRSTSPVFKVDSFTLACNSVSLCSYVHVHTICLKRKKKKHLEPWPNVIERLCQALCENECQILMPLHPNAHKIVQHELLRSVSVCHFETEKSTDQLCP